MDPKVLNLARLGGEVGLGVGTITGGACAAKYSTQLAVQDEAMKGTNNAVFAERNKWRMWVQYQISCYNSIIFNKNTDEQRKQEATDCKGHVQNTLKAKLEGIQWDHKIPGSTEANTFKNY